MHRQDAYAPSDVHLLVAPEHAYLSAILVCPLVRFCQFQARTIVGGVRQLPDRQCTGGDAYAPKMRSVAQASPMPKTFHIANGGHGRSVAPFYTYAPYRGL